MAGSRPRQTPTCSPELDLSSGAFVLRELERTAMICWTLPTSFERSQVSSAQKILKLAEGGVFLFVFSTQKTKT